MPSPCFTRSASSRTVMQLAGDTDQGIGGFGEEPGIKSQLMNLIWSVRTVMRVPLVIVNSIAIVLLLLFGWRSAGEMETPKKSCQQKLLLQSLLKYTYLSWLSLDLTIKPESLFIWLFKMLHLQFYCEKIRSSEAITIEDWNTFDCWLLIKVHAMEKIVNRAQECHFCVFRDFSLWLLRDEFFFSKFL